MLVSGNVSTNVKKHNSSRCRLLKMGTVTIHDDIAEYIGFMKTRMMWYGITVTWSKSPYDRIRKFYTEVRWILFLILFFVCGISLSFTEDYGLFDGTFVYWPVCLMMTILTTIATFSGREQDVLTMSLNEHFLENSEPWMRAIKDKYIKSVWKFIKYYNTYNNTTAVLYMVVPLLADTILHYGFDYLQSPFQLPMPLSPFIRYNDTWNAKHYIVTAVNFWATAEVVLIVQWFLANFSLPTVFVLTELVILKNQVKALNFENEEDLEEQIVNVVNKHNKIIKLCKDLKEFLGLSSAFICFFTSLALTFTAFTMYTSSILPVRLSYGCGFTLYFSGALLYCLLGQQLENESDEVFKALYGLRWYQCKPDTRKSLNMMMRQARTPLNIHYHGRYKMNLANFMQILRSTYSYFTLLQSMASKTTQ